MDEQIMRGRVYGADHDDPDPGPQPGHSYVELVGGPLDGLLLDVTGWTAHQLHEGAALPTELGRYGAGGRALYGPRNGDPKRFDWEGDTP
ncbi:hypothetical protein J7I98_17515 [Streptomyces sp. ISL-98]|uniref:hypothetical protein n=1 Tax=Streptomyces sp. ISL-98 TaxID=2819192 RepID=UPI001BE6B2E7|nr:hypothetical protein [Streptomyces sp. ISL-98]MBT2507653.1 hypothetical protein [Streptomyces sp. ISL-98]